MKGVAGAILLSLLISKAEQAVVKCNNTDQLYDEDNILLLPHECIILDNSGPLYFILHTTANIPGTNSKRSIIPHNTGISLLPSGHPFHADTTSINQYHFPHPLQHSFTTSRSLTAYLSPPPQTFTFCSLYGCHTLPEVSYYRLTLHTLPSPPCPSPPILLAQSNPSTFFSLCPTPINESLPLSTPDSLILPWDSSHSKTVFFLSLDSITPSLHPTPSSHPFPSLTRQSLTTPSFSTDIFISNLSQPCSQPSCSLTFGSIPIAPITVQDIYKCTNSLRTTSEELSVTPIDLPSSPTDEFIQPHSLQWLEENVKTPSLYAIRTPDSLYEFHLLSTELLYTIRRVEKNDFLFVSGLTQRLLLPNSLPEDLYYFESTTKVSEEIERRHSIGKLFLIEEMMKEVVKKDQREKNSRLTKYRIVLCNSCFSMKQYAVEMFAGLLKRDLKPLSKARRKAIEKERKLVVVAEKDSYVVIGGKKEGNEKGEYNGKGDGQQAMALRGRLPGGAKTMEEGTFETNKGQNDSSERKKNKWWKDPNLLVVLGLATVGLMATMTVCLSKKYSRKKRQNVDVSS